MPGEPFYLTASDVASSVEPGVEELAVAWQRVVAADRANLEKSAEAGDSRSIVGLALAKLDRQSTDYAPQEAQALLEQAVAAGDPDAKYRLAKVLEGGLGVDPDPGRALTLYEEAAEAKIPAALNDMGYFHFAGELGLAEGPRQGAGPVPGSGCTGPYRSDVQCGLFRGQWPCSRPWPEGAADLLYRSLRGGSELALDGLLNNADKFPQETWAGLQTILAEKGLYDGAVDGSFGPGTRRAVLAAYGIFETED